MTPAWLTLAFVSAITLGCAHPRMPAPTAHTPYPPPIRGDIFAGTARIDITPPPGLSTFGHGPDALATSGYSTRLMCRAFVFTAATGDVTAIVPCDLPAISVRLQREVSAEIARILPAETLPTTRLLLTATHTHAGPAHYFESLAFGGMMSTRRPGFDPEVLHFLATRIAAGVARAARESRQVEVRWVRQTLWGLSRNRNLSAHLANASFVPPDPEVLPPPTALNPVQRAVDPVLDTLQLLDATSGAPMGMLAFFGMHPTVLPAHERLIGADVFGVASRVAERELRRMGAGAGTSGIDPLVGLINTNEGDLSPTWLEGTRREVLRIGAELGAKLWEAARDTATPWSGAVVLDSRYLEVRLPAAPYYTTSRSGERFSGVATRLCSEPVLGEASGHGASDHEASTHTLFDPVPVGAEPDESERHRCQAPKRQMLGGIQPLLLSPTGFPDVVSLSLLRFGQRWIAAVPAEMTVEAGRRLRRRIESYAAAVDGPHTRALVAGLANGYLLYVTTGEEYQAQGYEGASTLYGGGTLELLEDRFSRLASSLTQGTAPPEFGVASAFEYKLAPTCSRMAPIAPRVPEDHRIEGACRLGRGPAAGACLWWRDGGPSEVTLTSAPFVSLVNTGGSPTRNCGAMLPTSLPVCDPEGLVDDRGGEFQTRVTERLSASYRWVTVFEPAAEFSAPSTDFDHARLRVGTLTSAPLGALPICKACDLRFCSGQSEPVCH